MVFMLNACHSNNYEYGSKYHICRVDVKIRVRVKGVKRILIGIRCNHYAIDEIFTSANIIMIEFDK